MSVIQTWFGQDLQKAVKVNHIDGNLFSHNGNGNSIGVRVYNDGEPVTLTGTVSGYVITSDGSTVPCVGARSGNEATITIPPAAYQPGNAFITIFLTDGSTVTTLCAVQTTVLQARTGSQVSPGSVVTDWTQTINAAMQSVEDAAENLGGIIATPYASLTYPVPLGKYTYYNSNLYRCISPIETSEEFTAAHWTQVKLGDDVSALKSAFDAISDVEYSKNLYDPSAISPGFINETNGNVESPSSTSSKHTDYISVNQTFVISVNDLANTAFRYAIYNTEKTFISGGYLSTFSTASDGRKYLVVSNANAAYIRFSDYNALMLREWQIENGNAPTAYEAYHAPIYKIDSNIVIPQNQIEGLTATLDELEGLPEETEELQTKVNDMAITEEYDEPYFSVYTEPYASGYMAPNGTVSTSSTLFYSNKIPVKPGYALTGISTDHTQDINLRMVCAFHDDTVIPSAGNESDLPTYTVPEGVNFVVVTQRNAPQGKIRSVEVKGFDASVATNIKTNPMGYMRVTGNMSDGDELHVSENNVKNNVCAVFSANVTTFSKLIIGQRNGQSWNTSYIEIDNTNVVLHTDQGNATAAHGLTIGSDIQILIETENSAETSIVRICSDGEVYNDTLPHRWICDTGYLAAVSDGSILTDCVLSWTSRNINDPIWIFGDSYVSLYDVRWIYYLLQDGFDRVMINGYAGEQSAAAMTALNNLLEVRKPQYIFWILGMNNGDTSTGVNESWKENYDLLINLCKKYNITPIFGTIPSVPTVNNSFKNQIIRSSGYRYVDFAIAVDPDEDGEWITGLLSGDGIHPSTKGAKVLYQRAIADFPELMSK